MAGAASAANPVAPASPSPDCDIAAQYLARGDYTRALRALGPATSRGSSDAHQLNLRGIAHLLAGRPAEALKAFEQALGSEPTLHEARLNRGVALLRLSKSRAASADFEAIYALDDENPLRSSAAFHRGLTALAEGDAAGAEQWLDKVLTLEPEHTAAHLVIGVALERQGKFQLAGTHYRQVLMRQPESSVALLRFGISAYRAGHPENAAKYLRRVIELQPGTLEAQEAEKFLVLME